jgi:hypothetical protein
MTNFNLNGQWMRLHAAFKIPPLEKESLMKKVIVLSLLIALALVACDAMTNPTEAPVIEPTPIPPTAEVIVVTVEVPVEVTVLQPSAALPTAAPAEAQPPTPAPTEAAPATAAPTQAAPAASASTGGPVAVDASLLGSFFKDVTYSNPAFSLRCPPKEITFNATAADPNISFVDFYYRMEDRNGTTITQWKNAGRMQPSANGIFSLTLSGEDIHPDWRMDLAWFDFQLVGLSKQGAAVGRTEKIVYLVTYTIDCQS